MGEGAIAKRRAHRAKGLRVAGEAPTAKCNVRHVIDRHRSIQPSALAPRSAEDQGTVRSVGIQRPTVVALRVADRRATQIDRSGGDQQTARVAPGAGILQTVLAATPARHRTVQTKAELIPSAVGNAALALPELATIARRDVALGLRCGIQLRGDASRARVGFAPRVHRAAITARPGTAPRATGNLVSTGHRRRLRAKDRHRREARVAVRLCNRGASQDRNGITTPGHRGRNPSNQSTAVNLRHSGATAVTGAKDAMKANAFKRSSPAPAWDRDAKWKTGSAQGASP